MTISETRTGGCHARKLQAVGFCRAPASLLSQEAGALMPGDCQATRSQPLNHITGASAQQRRQGLPFQPGAAQEKGRVGDWEADTIVGAGHKGALVSIVNRSSKFAILQLVGGKEFGGSGRGGGEEALAPHGGCAYDHL